MGRRLTPAQQPHRFGNASLFYCAAEAGFQGLAALGALGDDGSQVRDAIVEGWMRAEQLSEGALVFRLAADLLQRAQKLQQSAGGVPRLSSHQRASLVCAVLFVTA